MNDRVYDQREALHEVQSQRKSHESRLQHLARHEAVDSAGYTVPDRSDSYPDPAGGVERRNADRVAYDSSPRADKEAKMRAWQSSLEKAYHILRAHGHCGDASTLEDIARLLRDVKP